MKIAHELDGTPRITAYDKGDLVRLMRDERGLVAMGKAGDWGRVEDRTKSGFLTIRIAGYSQPADSTIVRLTDIPPGIVQPCNRRGNPTPPKPLYVRSPRPKTARPITTPKARTSAWRSLAILSVCVVAASVGAVLPAN
jgi:hypothetical protein